MDRIQHNPLQQQRERLHRLDHDDLQQVAANAQAEAAEVRRRYECGELTVEEAAECQRRPRMLIISIAAELEQRGAAE